MYNDDDAKRNGASHSLAGCCREVDGAPYKQRRLRSGLWGPGPGPGPGLGPGPGPGPGSGCAWWRLSLGIWGPEGSGGGHCRAVKGPRHWGEGSGLQGQGGAPSPHLGPQDLLPGAMATGLHCRSHLPLGVMEPQAGGGDGGSEPSAPLLQSCHRLSKQKPSLLRSSKSPDQRGSFPQRRVGSATCPANQ